MQTLKRDAEIVCERNLLLKERGYDLYIFRADESGRIITGFPYSKMNMINRCIYSEEFRGSERREYILKMLRGFSRAPFMMSCESGCALIVRSMAPVANICAAIIINISPDCMGNLAEKGFFDRVVLPPGLCVNPKKIKKADKHECDMAESAYRCVCKGFYSFKGGEYLIETEKVIKRVYATISGLGQLSACSCMCMTDKRIICDRLAEFNKRFDRDIFTVFMLLSLIACGRVGLCREASIRYSIHNGEPLVNIETEIISNIKSLPEIDECRRIADRRRLLYECSVIKSKDKSIIKICFSPVRYDWSVLGVKNSIEIDYD